MHLLIPRYFQPAALAGIAGSGGQREPTGNVS